MICPRCGKPAEEGMNHCPYCGAPLQQDSQQASTPRYTAAPTPGPALAGNSAEPPVIQLMRRMARSPYFLVPAIGFTCMVAFNLAAGLFNASPAVLESYLAPLYAYSNDAQMASIADTLSVVLTASAGGALLGQIPAILVAVSIWMMYATAVNESGKPLQTAGLTIIRVLQIISLVLVCLTALLIVVIFGLVFVGLGQFDDAGAAMAVMAVVLVLIAVIFALDIVYYVKLVGLLNNLRQTIWTGTPQGKISSYVAVLSILGGVVSLGTFLTGNVFSGLAGVASAVSGIGFGIFLFQYRDQLRALEPQNTAMPGAYSYEYRS